jgi:hypothetical protein
MAEDTAKRVIPLGDKDDHDILVEIYVTLKTVCAKQEKQDELLDRLFTRSADNANGIASLRAAQYTTWAVFLLVISLILTNIFNKTQGLP